MNMLMSAVYSNFYIFSQLSHVQFFTEGIGTIICAVTSSLYKQSLSD